MHQMCHTGYAFPLLLRGGGRQRAGGDEQHIVQLAALQAV